ncbi:MAG: SPOR domain-containing protein, partial [Candidatus Omnitrophica bacterium]|nr:SPOR domain-containing protein [Candidatus Omnitrophota bacterium]
SESSPYIQVASFRTDKYASKEMQRLQSNGYQPFTLKWGKYRVVCVGGYNDPEEAKQALKQLKKVYADCILRKK